MSRTTAQMAAAHSLVAELARRLGPALDAMTRLAADGYPSGHTGAGEGGWVVKDPDGTVVDRVPVTTVEAAVSSRWAVDRDHHELLEVVATIASAAHRGLDVVQAYERPTPDAVARARCTGGVSEQGGLEWGRPECDNIASRNGLCDACRKRKDRWTRRRDVA